MSAQRSNYDDPWEGVDFNEPDRQPERDGSSPLVWVAAIGGGLTLCILCAVVLAFGYFQLSGDEATPIASTLAVPTLPAEAENPLVVPTIPVAPTLAVAPTVTAAVGSVPTPTVAPTIPAPAPTNTPDNGRAVAVQRPAPPAIDGNLNEWDRENAIMSAFRVYADPGWDGTDDLEAVWYLNWDNSNLYIAATIVDNVHVQTQTGNQIFRGDSVDLQIDTNLPAGATLVNPATFQVILSPGNFTDLPPSAFLFQGNDEGQVRDAPGGNQIQVAALPTGSGYTIEAAIPWSNLNVTPAAGLSLGLALNVNDNDTPNSAVQEVMMSSVPTRTLRNPSTWGMLTLR